MASDATGVLDEAYQRLHETGPEYEGWLSNHGPMAAEAMARHGHADVVSPWLLPGSAASATHGIIRVGHAIRALLIDGDDHVHVAELAHGLAYWAARWQPYPGTDSQHAQAPDMTPAAALAAVPRLADQSGGFRDRF